MKLFTIFAAIVASVVSISASAYNGRRGGPVVVQGGRHYHGGGVRVHPNHWGHHPGRGHHPGHHWNPPRFRPPHYQPPHYRPPVYPLPPPVVMPPILPPPIEEPGVIIPNPIPDPIEEQSIYGYFPRQVFVNEYCDPREYAVPVVNTVPEATIYCPRNYWSQCSQAVLPYPGLSVRPVVYPYAVRPDYCRVQPTHQRGIFVLLRSNQNWHVGPAQNIAYLLNQYRAMGLCY